MESQVRIRNAEKRDCAAIIKLIKELSEFEKMSDQAKLTVEDLERDGFDSNPPFFQCLVAETLNPPGNDTQSADDNSSEVIGYALYFPKYSTWDGKALHLEDLYVTPSLRGKGIGTKFLKTLAKVAVDGGYARLSLECLGWNKPALDYYKSLDARDLTVEEDWHSVRFVRSALVKIAESDCKTNLLLQ